MHVVSHTHWDREWYLTFQRFRMRLVALIDNLLAIFDRDPDFAYFNFDGQTIILEDYLQIRPEKRQLIERYVREGRILIGPWYILNDEFLVSGESSVRSLLIGHRIAQEFGCVAKVGYLPDQFGNISQMPQILRGFGIDNAIFGRGLSIRDGRKMEFQWQSPDGSSVLASLMAFWYNNAQRFPADTQEAVAYTTRIRDVMKPVAATDQLLLMNGVDHLEAQSDISGIIARVNEKLDGDRLVHSSLVAYVEALRQATLGLKLDTIAGELREDINGSVLAGTLSSRMYLKQANEVTQTALEKYAEPMCSFATSLGGEYPDGFLNYAWKLLLQNHPHDSICGCSIDQVHKEMMPRFEQVQQIAGDLTERALKSICKQINTESDSLVIFNTLGFVRTDRVRAVIDFPVSDISRIKPVYDESRDVAAIRLVDDGGEEIPYHLLSSAVIPDQVLRPDELPMLRLVRRFEIELVAEDVPACGYKVYRIERVGQTPKYDGTLTASLPGEFAIENEFVRVSVIDGVLRIERRDGKGCLLGGNTFEDTGDVGDEYYHVEPMRNLMTLLNCCSGQTTVIDNGPISATLRFDTCLRVPAECSIDGTARSESLVDCPISTFVTLTRGVPRVDIHTVIDNKAKDHRIRVLFPSAIATDSSSADGQFDVVSRRINLPHDWIKASPFYPQQRWVDVSDGSRGVCVINKGLPEYEVYNDNARTVAVTLLRCVGHLSGGVAGGADMPGAELTPDAQCIGKYEFDYAVYLHDGDWQYARVWKQALQHNVPLLVTQMSPNTGQLPANHSFLEISSPDLVLSAIKKAYDNDTIVVRFYNPTGLTIKDAAIRLNGAVSARLLNLNEETIGDVWFENSSAILDVGAKQIVTLGFEI